jgi:hypothetical protein
LDHPFVSAPSGAPAFFIIDARWGEEDIMNETCVAVACRNASGIAELPLFTITATPRELSLGLHYDRAEALAEAAGYEGPFVCFDADEQDAIREAARRLERQNAARK